MEGSVYNGIGSNHLGCVHITGIITISITITNNFIGQILRTVILYPVYNSLTQW